MMLHIWATKGKITQPIADQTQKADLAEVLPKQLKSEEFKRAIIEYDEDHQHEIDTLDELVRELHKTGG